MEGQLSFYLEKNNNMFNSDVLVICYRANGEEMRRYGLTSENVLIFIKSKKISELDENCNYKYLNNLQKLFDGNEIIVRIQSECLLGMFGDSHCDCEQQRLNAIKIISDNGGMYIYLPQEAQGYGLYYKLKELELQVSGRLQNGEYVGKKTRDEAQKILLNSKAFSDQRNFEIVYNILKILNLTEYKYIMITDSDKKVQQMSKYNLKVEKYSTFVDSIVTTDNVSEYLIKIYNSTHYFDEKTIDKIIKILKQRDYNERTLAVLLNIIEKIENDKNYNMPEDIKRKFISMYNELICGREKKYILGDENHIKIQNNFSCKVNSTIFKTICNVYGKSIFDRISLEKIYYFVNKKTGESIRIRTGRVLDSVDNICKMFTGQTHVEQSTYSKETNRVTQKEISISKLRSFFENNDYSYVKRIEMVTIISENVIPGVNIYIKRLPNIENRIMDVFGKKENIQEFINKLINDNNRSLLNTINNEKLSEQNFSKYNLRFADLSGIIEEEVNIYYLTKEEEKNGVRSKVLLPERGTL